MATPGPMGQPRLVPHLSPLPRAHRPRRLRVDGLHHHLHPAHHQRHVLHREQGVQAAHARAV